MKINPVYGNGNNINGNYKTNDERKNGYVEGNTVNKTTVEISDQAKALVKRIGESEDSTFSDKVEAIRRSIQESSYVVDTEKIADKMLEKIYLDRTGSNE